MTPARLTEFLFTLTDTLAIPHPIVVFVLVSICVTVLYRWGALIFDPAHGTLQQNAARIFR